MTFLTQAFAFEDLSKSMVPRSKIHETRGRTYLLRTKAGSNVTIRYNLDGTFKDASGVDINRGDELEPGEGLLSLSTVAQLAKKNGEKLAGFWILEKDQQLGWLYDIGGTLINAKTGKMISHGIELKTTTSLFP